MSIEALNISKHYGDFKALANVSVNFPTGELVALLGPSGSGKTTLLRIIAGLETTDAGRIRFDGDDITLRHARERHVGFVFQHYALFRHMTVFENIAFGLRVKPRAERPADDVIRRRVGELLKLVQLDWLGDRYPNQLSGGQRQRVALARALAVQPKVLLLDEPFGALDAKVRKELRAWLRRLHDEIHVTSIFVTHDVEEALEVADRVVVMSQGRVEQIGTPDEVYENPATPFVHDFLGGGNIVSLPGATDEKPAYVRAHDLELSRERRAATQWEALVESVRAVGPQVKVTLREHPGGSLLHAEIPRMRQRELALTPGETVYVEPRHLKRFTEDYAI